MTTVDLSALPAPRQRRRKGTTAPAAAGKAAIYLRTSTDDQAGSLGSQERACRALCEARGLDGAAVFTDAGQSGGNVQRPALAELRATVAAGEVAVVVVYALDRLSRSQADTLALLAEFEDAGAGLTAASQAFDTTTPMGRAMIGMLSTFAELQRAEIRQRTRTALAAKRARGEVTQRTPFGLARDGRRFVRCPDQWPVVERILRDRVAGLSCERIASSLNAEGVATPTGAGRWHAAGVARLARSPVILAAAQTATGAQSSGTMAS